MHIGLYSPVWPSGDMANGIVTYVRILREGLRRRGHRVTVFSGRCDTSDAEGSVRVALSRRSAGWAAIRRRLGRWPEAPYDFGLAIAETVARHHENDPLDVFEMEESFGWCQEVTARLRAPTVVKLHGPAFLSLIDGAGETPERRKRIECEGEALRAANAVVSPSSSTLRATAARYGLRPDTLLTVPNPVTPVADSAVWRADAASLNEILFVGRFDYRKGGDAVLQAFGRIAASRPELKLTFVGPDPGLRLASGELQHFGDYVRSHFEPAVADRIEYLGSQPSGAIVPLRQRAAVTVTATRWESFGYVVAEAMNQGCPVVGFDVDGVNELIEHDRTGLLAPLDDVEALTRLICRLLDDRAGAAALGARARESVVRSCGTDIVVDNMVALYRRLIDARAAGGGK